MNKENFKNESIELFNLIKDNNLILAKEKFVNYENKYKEIINNPQSSLHKALPFYKSIEEYLFNDFAKEKKITSLEIIWDNLENDLFII